MSQMDQDSRASAPRNGRWLAIVVSLIGLAAAITTVMMVGGKLWPIERAAGVQQRPQPRVAIARPLRHDFGKMSQMQRYSHPWEVKNDGDGDLEIWQESSTDTVTAKLALPPYTNEKRVRVKPKETSFVEIECRTKRTVNEFSAGCVIGTNDPNRPAFTLNVMGIVDPVEHR
jgi:hypothetical protein